MNYIHGHHAGKLEKSESQKFGVTPGDKISVSSAGCLRVDVSHFGKRAIHFVNCSTVALDYAAIDFIEVINLTQKETAVNFYVNITRDTAFVPTEVFDSGAVDA